MFKLQSPSKYSLSDAPIETFFWLLETVFELIDAGAFLCFCYLLFQLLYLGKMFPFEDCFHLRKQRSCLGQDWLNREGGA